VRLDGGLGMKALRLATGSCVTASVGRPTDVDVDGEGRVLVCDGDLSRLVRLSPEGCSPRPFEVMTSPLFATPTGVAAFPAGIALSDAGRGKVFLLDEASGDVQGELVSPKGWKRPGQMHWDGALLHIVDAGRHVVESFDGQGRWQRTLGGEGGAPGQFLHPVAVAADPDGDLWVLDALNHRVQCFNAQGAFVSSFGVYDHAPGGFMFPKGLAFDGDGNLYVSDAAFSRIQVFSRSGALLYWFGGTGRAGDQFLLPSALCFRGGRLHIVDQYNRRVQAYRYLPYLSAELPVGEVAP
jgi:DNA-binding beta-propeller fold protein YncE